MAKRVTIMIANDLDRKVRIRQADLIRKNGTSYSFSAVIGEILKKGLK